ncbi:MAG: HNH endonuclease signature motif containing protein [Smithella sp.]
MIKTPEIVADIVKAVSEKLGREAISRKVNNREEYFILDLAFSYFQRADRNRRNDYRGGYLFFEKEGKNHLLFVLAHTPIMTSFFKNNFEYDVFKNIILDTEQYRDEHFLRLKKNSKYERIKTTDIQEFIYRLDKIEENGFARSVFGKDDKGKTGVGNIFVLCLGRGFKQQDISEIISKSWYLFLWLYPSKPVFTRNASLSRNLQKIEAKCEIGKIKNLPQNILSSVCSGQIEAAHIKPYKHGGSDKLSNGLWLCNHHHRITEGKLEGCRGIDTYEVNYNN